MKTWYLLGLIGVSSLLHFRCDSTHEKLCNKGSWDSIVERHCKKKDYEKGIHRHCYKNREGFKEVAKCYVNHILNFIV